VLIFDGDCGFCTSSAAWIARHWAGPGRTVPWQRLGRDELAQLGLTVAQVQAAAWWVDGQGRTWRGHLAVARALTAASGGWGALGRIVLVPPVRWLAAAGYRLVTRYRYRLPGGTPACRMPGESP
jgi:predicted DCC family thiol-disulfide oxidoreductase YuxK